MEGGIRRSSNEDKGSIELFIRNKPILLALVPIAIFSGMVMFLLDPSRIDGGQR